MKLYDFAMAPNAQRVRIFLAEKGLEVPTEQLNIREDKQFVEPFTSMNPFHCVPFLALDDGTVIAESISICRYLEELHPEPPLFGSRSGTSEAATALLPSPPATRRRHRFPATATALPEPPPLSLRRRGSPTVATALPPPRPPSRHRRRSSVAATALPRPPPLSLRRRD